MGKNKKKKKEAMLNHFGKCMLEVIWLEGNQAWVTFACNLELTSFTDMIQFEQEYLVWKPHVILLSTTQFFILLKKVHGGVLMGV